MGEAALVGLQDLAAMHGGELIEGGIAAARPKAGSGKGGRHPGEATRFKPGVRTAGRQKGQPNKLTVSLREAVELAVQPGQCHPNGFAGWLVDRAKGGVEDRKIFAGVVGRVIPLQIEKKSDTTMRIELGWLNGRDVGRHLSQSAGNGTQVIDITAEPASSPLIKDQNAATQAPEAPAAGQAGEQE